MVVSRRNSTSHATGHVRPVVLIGFGVLAAALIAGFVFLHKSGPSPSRDLSRRPPGRKLLFDYAGLLSLQDEAVEDYLSGIRDNQKIETVIVTLPSLAGFRTIEEAAAKIMTDWKIGDAYGNKGILLLLAEAEKEAKLEVTYELEDVFTDLFSGTVEDKQLKPHLRSGDIGGGLVAVMEEIENRAQIKHLGQYTPKLIADLDAQYASGGAGARKELARYALESRPEVAASILTPGSSVFTDSALLSFGFKKDPRFPAGRTPQEAFETMRAAIYAQGDARDIERFKNNERMSFEVLQGGHRAVIYFGNTQDWNFAPFLFAKLPDGWKFDIVSQKLIVRFGNAPYWAVEHGDFDYMDLLAKCPSWQDVDVPWEEGDLYRVERDSQMVADILRLEEAYRNNPDNFETALALGRLGVITGRNLNQIFPYLEKAMSLKPDDPAPYKYLAIANVIMSYQHQKAIALVEEMLKRDPGSVFGLKFLGFLRFQTGDVPAAETNLKAALKLAPSDCYAVAMLGRISVARFKQSGSFEDRKTAVELYIKTRGCCAGNPKRATWFKNALSRFPRPSAFLGSNFFGYADRNQGVVVSDVMPDGPAARGGLQDGDFILSFDGLPIYDDYEFAIFIGGCQPGEKAIFEIVRGALDGPVTAGNVTVVPRTAGLHPPRRLKIEVTFGDRERARSTVY